MAFFKVSTAADAIKDSGTGGNLFLNQVYMT